MARWEQSITQRPTENPETINHKKRMIEIFILVKVGEKNGTNERQRMPERDTGRQVNAMSMSVNRWCEFPGTETGTIEEERLTVV